LYIHTSPVYNQNSPMYSQMNPVQSQKCPVIPNKLLSGFIWDYCEKWGAGVEDQKNVREEIGGWGRVPFNEPYAPSLCTIYDGA